MSSYYAELKRRPPAPGASAPDPTRPRAGRTSAGAEVALSQREVPYAVVDNRDLKATELESRQRADQVGDRILAAVSGSLREAKLRGEPFGEAWKRALAEAELADGWKMALDGTKRCWQLAYEDEPDPAQHVLARLATLLEPDGGLAFELGRAHGMLTGA